MAFVMAGIVIAAIISAVIISKVSGKKKIIRDVTAAIDAPPARNRFNEIESISEYYLYAKQTDINADDITWNDLDMDELFDRINTCESSIGEEYLYALLHRRPDLKEEELFRRGLKLLNGDRELRIRVCAALHDLGIFNYNSVAKTCLGNGFTADAGIMGSGKLFKFLPFMPFAVTAVLIPFLGWGAAAGFIAGSLVNMVVYYKTYIKISLETGMMKYLCKVFCCAKSLSELSPDPVFKELAEMFKPFSEIAKLLYAMGKPPDSDSMGEIVNTYIKIITFKEQNAYFELRQLAEKYPDEIRRLYDRVGMLDAVCAVLNFRASIPMWCEPEFTDERRIMAVGVVSPLIHDPVGNDFDMRENILITGSNASGKSSFAKAMAVNAILAQSIFTCTAEKFYLRRCRVITSMAVRDNICAGESYFVAEIRSMRRVVDMAGEEFCFCVIDEILKGTNTAERIAASVSVLTFLAKTESLCAAATHDTELTEILKKTFRNVHFSERVENDEVTFDYKIKEGAAQTRNAIKLLKINGFSAEITDMAERLAEKRG